MEKEMELEVKRFMAGEIAKGTSLSDLQQLVNEKFNQKLTYMDIRIMASELDGIDWNAHDPKAQAKAKAEEKAAAKEADDAEEADGGDALEPDVEAEPGDGKTVVEVSKLVRPGTALSGTVKFASGSSAEWYVDQFGRLGLENLRGEKPTQADIEAVQKELERVFAR